MSENMKTEFRLQHLPNATVTDQTMDIPFAEQRRLIRLRMHKQRELIACKIEPSFSVSEAYPRSVSMRFLIQHQVMIVGALAGTVALLARGRYVKPLTTALAMARVLRSVALKPAT